ncbi:hypothetical protein, partial [Klebsiella pneumoniae]|uniref:hypothetical protein n=1 Tax=Klebsiella pneumoniae TaxID=573 RepID=UPI002163B970
QTETEATGAPQKHHYTLNQQVGSITNAFSIIITISLVLFILDFTYIVTIESYRISDRSFSMSSLPTRKLKHKNS